MQCQLLPAVRSGVGPSCNPSFIKLSFCCLRRPSHSFSCTPDTISSICSWALLERSSSLYLITDNHSKKPLASSPITAAYSAPNDDSEKQAKIAQVSKRLESTSRYFKRLGSFGFWSQLVATVVSAVILSFSIIVTGRITSPFTFYSAAGSISAAFISVFWSFGYIRLSEKLGKMASDPSKAPSRAYVVRSLRNGIGLNLLGIGAAILGMLATVGLLVVKALTTSAAPYYQGTPPGYSPVLASDVFFVHASVNTILAHFLGLLCSLELLRLVTLPPESVRVSRVTDYNG